MRSRKKKEVSALARGARRITVFSSPRERHRGILHCGGLMLKCALGRSGVTYLKHEGDGATPAGRHRLLFLDYRSDRLARPRTQLSTRVLRRNDGWCEDPGHGRYNCAIRLPSSAGHESMWREDNLYDLVGVFDWNMRPRIRGRGSAIFLHLCRSGYGPTAGCVALEKSDLLRLLTACGPRPEMLIAAKSRRLPQKRTKGPSCSR
jgi:L,D-peptidoglycan transpeptidase YkuD (ErfK/YbiS/YcfS/YnhG family)